MLDLGLDPGLVLDLVYGLWGRSEPVMGFGSPLGSVPPRLLVVVTAQPAAGHRLRMQDGLGSGLIVTLLAQEVAVPFRWGSSGSELLGVE